MLCPSFPSLFCGMGSGHSPPALRETPQRPSLQPGTFSSPACAMTSSTRLTSCLAGGAATASGCGRGDRAAARSRTTSPTWLSGRHNFAYGMPSSSAEPTSAGSRPRITRFVADLLAPLGLTNPVTCPGRMAKVISSSAIVDPNRLRSLLLQWLLPCQRRYGTAIGPVVTQGSGLYRPLHEGHPRRLSLLRGDFRGSSPAC
jgi:hypothetical protein